MATDNERLHDAWRLLNLAKDYVPPGSEVRLSIKEFLQTPPAAPGFPASVAIDTCVEQFPTIRQTVETLEKLIGMQKTPGLSVSPMLLNALFRLGECQLLMCIEWPSEKQKAGGHDDAAALAERFNLLRKNSDITWVEEVWI